MYPSLSLLALEEPGGYISIFKVVLVFLLLLGWARALTWIDKDAPAAHLPREICNAGVFGAGIGGVLLFLFLPGFFVAFVVLLFLLIGGPAAYFVVRARAVGLDDLKRAFAEWRKGMRKEKKQEALPGQVVIVGRNGNPLPEPDADSPERPGYDAVQRMLTDPLRKNAERVDVRPVEGFYGVQVVIDGMPYNAPSLERAAASSGITFLKRAAGLDINDRRKPQTGTVRTLIDRVRHELEVQTAGSTAGEFLRVTRDPKKRHEKKIEDLGMSAEQLEALRGAVQDGRGVVLVAAPKGQGLSTMLYSILRAHDAFLTHIQSIERHMEADIEGVTQTRLPAGATGADELKQVEWVISQQPDTIMIDSIVEGASARALIQFAGDKRAYVGMRAANSFDALGTWRKLVGDDPLAMSNLRLVLAGRVVRKLCAACKTAYAPDPQQLRKMNLDPTRVQRLYSARAQPLRDNKGNVVPCEFCQELRYKGRFGIYEVLQIDDEMRQAAISGGTAQQLLKLFRKQRGRLVQEAGLAAVEAGDTSVQEVLRVMKGEAT